MLSHWRHVVNTTELSVCGGDVALCQITLTTCLLYSSCVRSTVLLHGSEAWPVRKENKNSSGDEIANVNFFTTTS